jgi:Sec-independent protein translocase protein TatA
MFDSVSWGELGVLLGLGLTLVGRKDLPHAARLAGTQVGRIVGLLQGARVRADRFAAQNELRQLQNELRSGLRELDTVKSELAVSMSGRGMMGRTLGATTSGVNHNDHKNNHNHNSDSNYIAAAQHAIPGLTTGAGSMTESPPATATAHHSFHHDYTPSSSSSSLLAPKQQSIAAVAEDEWARQGIAFASKAEQGAGKDVSTSGSVLLSKLLQQSLIFDQYDRVVAEQDIALQAKVKQAKEAATAATTTGAATRTDKGKNKTDDQPK